MLVRSFRNSSGDCFQNLLGRSSRGFSGIRVQGTCGNAATANFLAAVVSVLCWGAATVKFPAADFFQGPALECSYS